MSTFYKYAERNADSYINWAEIGKDMTTMLNDENKRREDEKAAIDKVTKEGFDALANGPQGEHEGINQWWLDYADNGSKYLKMQDDLLKSGQLKVRDFVKNRQNLMDGTDQATKLVQSYQDEYADKMTRLKENKSQALETWATASVEGFADFSKSRLYVNPATGAVSVAMMTKKRVDGKDVYAMDDTPSSFMTVNEMQGRIKAKFDRFDVDGALDKYVGGLGEKISIVERMGKLGGKTVSQFLNAPDKEYSDVAFKFVEAETDALKSFMTNPYNMSSIMTENIKDANGKVYDFTQDPNEAKRDKSKIYVTTDPKSGMVTPQFTDEQKKDVLEWLRGQARLRYDQKSTVADVKYPAEFAPQEWLSDASAKRKQLNDEGNFIGKLYSGTDAEIESAVQHFNGRSTTAHMERTPTGVKIIYKDGSSKPFNFKSGNSLVTKEDFIRGVAPMLLGDDIDVNQVLKGAVATSSNAFNPTANVSATTTYKESPMVTFSNNVKSNTNKAVTVLRENIDQYAVPKLQAIYGGYGVTFEKSSDKNKVKVVSKDGKKTIEITTKGDSDSNAKNADAIQAFILANTPLEDQVRVSQTMSGGVGSKY